jgi:spermidine synthase
MTRRWPILVIFMLSGAAGLVYEVVWARQLVLVFGNTTQAVSAILTGFFGGMAIGSAFGGRIGDRVRRPLRLYGILELVLVLVVLATPITFRLLHEVYRGAFGWLEGHSGLLTLVRFALSLAALGPATILMGATLPILTRYLTRDSARLSLQFGRLYAANTLGAIVGTIASGFALIELLGLQGTLVVGAACSAIAGAVALIIDRGRASQSIDLEERSNSAGTAKPQSRAAFSTTPLRAAIAVSFVSGLTSLGYQVLWIRLIASGTGNSTYVFTTILAVFLIGITLGTLLFNRLKGGIDDTAGFVAQCQCMIALLVVVPTVVAIHRHPTGLLDFSTRFGAVFPEFVLFVTLVVLPATFLMGLTLPAIMALAGDSPGRVGTTTGLVLSANTIGAIGGTLVVPFFLVPAVGSSKSIALLSLANICVAVALVSRKGIRSGSTRLSVRLAGAGLATAIVAGLVAGQVFVDPNEVFVKANGGRVFSSRDDEIASVQAGELLDARQLWVTGTSMTLLTVDAKLMPILPLMLRPESRTALAVAFGMGSTFRSALIAGLRTDVVELVPSVPLMFHWFYPDAARILSDPNGRVIISDGRNHMELTDRKYDIIVTDPPPPIESSGVSVISSREYYAAGRTRLTSGGVMMQWVPYGQTIDEFRAHVRTFRSVFAHVIIALGPGGHGFYMLGSSQPIAFDPGVIRKVLSRPRITEDLSSAYDSPEKTPEGWAGIVPRLVWIDGNRVAEFAGTGPLISDDRPLPEYFFIRHLVGRQSPRLTPDLLKQLAAQLPSSLPASLRLIHPAHN